MAADCKQLTVEDFNDRIIYGIPEKNGKLVISTPAAFESFLKYSEQWGPLLSEGKFSFFPGMGGVNSTLSLRAPGELCLYRPPYPLVDIAVLQQKFDIAKILVEDYGATPTERYENAAQQYYNPIQKAELRRAFEDAVKDESQPITSYTFFGKIWDLMGEQQKFIESLNSTQSLNDAKALVERVLNQPILSRELRTKVEAVDEKITVLEQLQNGQRVSLQRK